MSRVPVASLIPYEVHCSRKSDTARRGGIAGNSENVSPPNRTGTLDQQAPSVSTSRVWKREPSVGNSENLVPLVRMYASEELQVDKSGGLAYRRAAARAVGVSSASR
jgi:hypothetical protein